MPDDELLDRQKALQILNQDSKSNLGWRIILSVGNQETARDRVKEAHKKGCSLVDVIAPDQRDAVIAEAKFWAAQHAEVDLADESEEPIQTVAVTSYEGSKGVPHYMCS